MFISKSKRLALLERKTAIPADGLVLPFERQPEVVHGMAGLVHRAEKTRERIDGIEARRDPDVAGHPFGERVFALVQTASIEREAHGLQDFERRLTGREIENLPVNGIGARSA